jgi:Ca2+-binding RTX toxin-like protein
VISVDPSPLLGNASLSLDAAGGRDTLTIDFSAFGAINFVVEANGSVTVNVPATLLNFEVFQVTGSAVSDSISTGGDSDTVHGSGGNDIIHAGGGNDLLDGGSGADALFGGAGDDVYLVDSASDAIGEDAGMGSDEIRTGLASFSLELLANVENLLGTATAGQTLIGNALVNRISGGAGNDYLIGRGGADVLQGNMGDDTYLVEDAATVILENPGTGYDTIYTTVSYALSPNYGEIEKMAVFDATTTNAVNLTGGHYNQAMYGNAGANSFDGGGGTDTMYGLGGDDIYLIDSADDRVFEVAGEGADTILAQTSFILAAGSAVETLAAYFSASTAALNLTGNEFSQLLSGNAGNNILTGGGGNDSLLGGAGRDTLTGGLGQDRLTGGSGADTFVFADVGESPTSAYRSDGAKTLPDIIFDFASGVDRIDLSAIDANAGTAGNDAFTYLGTAAFTGHAGELRFEQQGAQVLILADIDGNGVADMQIVAMTSSLQAVDFVC